MKIDKKNPMIENISPEEAYSFFILDLLSGYYIVNLSIYWLESDIYSETLCEICTNKDPIMSDISIKFMEIMSELNIITPNKIKAINKVIKVITKKVLENNIYPEKAASYLYQEIHIEFNHEFPDEKYVGDRWGLENIFCWLREIWDCRDGSIILYYTEQPRNEAMKKFKDNLVSEIKKRYLMKIV